MRKSLDVRRWVRWNVLPFGAILAASGCGSGDGGGPIKPTNNQNDDQNHAIGYAYVASAGPTPGSAGAVYEYAIGLDGSLSPLAEPSIAAGVNPSAVVVIQSGSVYVVNAGDGSISQYSIASDGTLKTLSPATVTNPGVQTRGVTGGAATVDPTGNYLYVANTADDNLAQFSGVGGSLTPLSPATVTTGVAPVSIAAGAAGLYVLNSGAPGAVGSVSQYTEADDGTLTATNFESVAAGTNPSVLALDDSYPLAYVLSNCDGTQCLGSIRAFSVGAGGALTDTGKVVTTGSHDRGAGMIFYSYAANDYAHVLTNAMGVDTESGALFSFQVGNTGALTATSPASFGIPGVVVTQATLRSTLFVLTTNSGVSANTPATGGSVVTYVLGDGGAVSFEATTELTAPYPSAIAVWTPLLP